MKRLTEWDEFGNADIIALSDMMVAKRLRRGFVGIEINPEYAKMAEKRISEEGTA